VILTDSAFTKARIQSIDEATSASATSTSGTWWWWRDSRASTNAGNITTLGRGGSDTSAVASPRR
jgi:aspartokinase